MKTEEKKIRPSQRSFASKEYYFSSKLREIELLKREGRSIINLAIGNPDLPPAKRVVNTLINAVEENGYHTYQSYRGIPELREAFCEWYKNYFDVKLDKESEILPLAGSKEGIVHISMAFLDPGDVILIPDPGYPAYQAAAGLCGAEVVHYKLDPSAGWRPDLKSIDKRVLKRAKLMWINYPNMPTGAMADTALFKEIVEFATKHEILVCNDNPYSFILNEEHKSILSIEGAKDVALELNSLSKSHNMPGWRIGMVAGKSIFIDAVLRVKSNTDSGMFRPVQLAAAKALKSKETWYESLNNIYRQRRNAAEKLMRSIGCRFESNQCGMFLWGKIPNVYKDSVELSDKLLSRAGVFIAPGSIFGESGSRYVRISLCADKRVFAEAVKRVEENL